jgi:hypothetical protein
LITPSALLIDNMELGRIRVPIVKDQDYVANPLIGQ